MRKCIIVPDSFKGSLNSTEICRIMKQQVNTIFPDCETVLLPVADGGEGTVECFLQAMGGTLVDVTVNDPYMKDVKSFYGRSGEMAVVEMAAAAGLPMVEGRLNPAKTSTYGVGQLIHHAVTNGAKQIVLGMGGSCTNDGGCGCAAALGVRFIDNSGKEFIPLGETLDQIKTIDISPAGAFLKGVQFVAMCDVENTMHGEQGAAYIFGPQKGADAAMVMSLDKQLKALDKTIQACLGKNISGIPGTGAAGALGAGVLAFFDAELKPGIETVLDIVGFEEKLRGADAVFTGEGKIDTQSLKGKVVIGVSRRAKKYGVPVIVIVGDVGDGIQTAYDMGVTAIFSINRIAEPFSQARLHSEKSLAYTAGDILRLIKTIEQKNCRLL